ncbi:NAD(P)-binding domain-containing protein, partial [Arthrospira platensis SPKY1]|nr:NAD(P)-binding domain-containing protein [Arthrospira platensis SPKY1]
MAAWDVKLLTPDQAWPLQSSAQASGVHLCGGVAELLDRSDLVISAVTASQALAVAEEVARLIRPGTWFLDLNSASPGTRLQAAGLIDQAGGRFVEAGVMTSVPPHGIRVPMLLGGPHAAGLAPQLSAWGMNVQVA